MCGENSFKPKVKPGKKDEENPFKPKTSLGLMPKRKIVKKRAEKIVMGIGAVAVGIRKPSKLEKRGDCELRLPKIEKTTKNSMYRSVLMSRNDSGCIRINKKR